MNRDTLGMLAGFLIIVASFVVAAVKIFGDTRRQELGARGMVARAVRLWAMQQNFGATAAATLVVLVLLALAGSFLYGVVVGFMR